MKRTTVSSFDVTKVSEVEKQRRPRSSMIGEMLPLPAIFAPFLNTAEDIGRMHGPAPREYIIPITVEPRSSTNVNKVHAQSRTSMMFSNHSGMKKASSTVMSTTSHGSAGTHNTSVSSTRRQSHSEPLMDKSAEAESQKHADKRGGASSLLLPLCVCILVFIVIISLVPLVFTTTARAPQHLYADTRQATEVPETTAMSTKPPVVGHVGFPCNDSVHCLGEAYCVGGVCHCEGPELRVVEGICLPASTSLTKQAQSVKTTTEKPSSKETPPPATDTEGLTTTTENAPETSDEYPGENTGVINGTVTYDEESHETTVWKVLESATPATTPSSTETAPPATDTEGLAITTENEPGMSEEYTGQNTAASNGTDTYDEDSHETAVWNFPEPATSATTLSDTEIRVATADTVRPDTATTTNYTDTAAKTSPQEPAQNTAAVNGTVIYEENPSVTTVSNITAASTPATTRSNTEIRAPPADTVSPGPTSSVTDSEPRTSEEDLRHSTAAVNATVLYEEGRRETASSNSPESPRPTTPRPNTEIRAPAARTLLPVRTTTTNASETAPEASEQTPAQKAAAVNMTVLYDEYSRGTAVSKLRDPSPPAPPRSSTERLAPAAVTVRPVTTTTSNATGTEKGAPAGKPGPNTATFNGTLLHEQDSHGTAASNFTAH